MPQGSTSNEPCVVLISAGFDGARGDEGCSRDDVSGIDLAPEDFHWVTAELKALANKCAEQQRLRAVAVHPQS